MRAAPPPLGPSRERAVRARVVERRERSERVVARRALAAWWAAALIAGGALAAAACGLTADFTGLQGGARDASPPPPGSTDATVGFCAARAAANRFCADFDTSPDVSAGWTALDTSSGQTARLDTMAFSPPGAFLSEVKPVAPPASVRLKESLPIDATHVRAEFEMLLAPSDGDFELFVLHEETPDGTTFGVFYKETGGNLLVYVKTLGADGGRTDVVHPLGAPLAGWMHVEIELDVSDAGTLTIKHDGAVVVSDANVPTSTPSRHAMFAELGFYSWEAKPARASFDDFVLDWR